MTSDEPLRTYQWSSYPAYLALPARRPAWMRVDRVLGEAGIFKDDAAGRRRFEQIMEERRRRDSPQPYEEIRRGWYVGTEAFRQGLLAGLEGRRHEAHYGRELAGSAEAKAEHLLAVTLRAETTMTLKWIAARLHMGTWTNVSTLLSNKRRNRS